MPNITMAKAEQVMKGPLRFYFEQTKLPKQSHHLTDHKMQHYASPPPPNLVEAQHMCTYVCVCVCAHIWQCEFHLAL